MDALISNEEVRTSGTSSIGEVPIERIQPNPSQPRREFDDEALQELPDTISEIGIVLSLIQNSEPTSPLYLA